MAARTDSPSTPLNPPFKHRLEKEVVGSCYATAEREIVSIGDDVAATRKRLSLISKIAKFWCLSLQESTCSKSLRVSLQSFRTWLGLWRQRSAGSFLSMGC